MSDFNIAICLLAILASCIGMFVMIISKLEKIEKRLKGFNNEKTDA